MAYITRKQLADYTSYFQRMRDRANNLSEEAATRKNELEHMRAHCDGLQWVYDRLNRRGDVAAALHNLIREMRDSITTSQTLLDLTA